MLFDEQRHWREAAALTEARAPLDGGGPLPPPPHLAPPRTLEEAFERHGEQGCGGRSWDY
jgi:hypothetical protein